MRGQMHMFSHKKATEKIFFGRVLFGVWRYARINYSAGFAFSSSKAAKIALINNSLVSVLIG